MSRLLIIEDDVNINEMLQEAFGKKGYEVVSAYSGTEGILRIEKETYQMVILDLMLPGTDGFEICRRVREVKNTPIIMVSAKKEDIDKIRGLGLGADDYITKPFGMLELISRIKAVLRRTSDNPSDYELHAGDITVNPGKHRVMVNGENVILTYKEFEMLCMLIESKGLVLSRNKLLESIWGYDFDGETRTIDVHIRSLRSKLGESGNIIETVRGVGYKIGADYET